MSRHELTSRIAYELYLQRGRAPGRQVEDWGLAESIVELCLAFAAALLEAASESASTGEAASSDADSTGAAAPSEAAVAPLRAVPALSTAERALALLEAATAELGRAEVADALGYKSTSSVGRYLRGERAIGDKLAEKIFAALARPAETKRRAA